MQRLNGAARPAPERKGNGARDSAPARPPVHDGLALEVLGKFREVYRAAKLQLTPAGRSFGVSGAELWAMWELRRRPGLRVSDLAQRLSLRQSTVSNLVERLVQARLLARKRNDPDGRVVRLYLTRAGDRVVTSAPRPARGLLPDALERLSAGDLRRLHAQLDRLLGKMALRTTGAVRGRLQNV
jgi:DNA-binding MarR family transcriptional regulator